MLRSCIVIVVKIQSQVLYSFSCVQGGEVRLYVFVCHIRHLSCIVIIVGVQCHVPSSVSCVQDGEVRLCETFFIVYYYSSGSAMTCVLSSVIGEQGGKVRLYGCVPVVLMFVSDSSK